MSAIHRQASAEKRAVYILSKFALGQELSRGEEEVLQYVIDLAENKSEAKIKNPPKDLKDSKVGDL